MAGTIQPIAALTPEDHGPINTIVSIVLTSASIIFTTIRLVVRQQKVLRVELDDVVFGVALCFGICTSVMSHFCVKAGLGQHQNEFKDEQIQHYAQLFWTTQFLGVVALASAKVSIICMFRRIDPVQLGPHTVKWLLPMVVIYTALGFFLIGFQCQLPQPWVLSPTQCSTHGQVYYPITIANIVTDALLAFWIFPILWELQMKPHTKRIVMWLFGSRFLVCIVDIGRMIVIHKALQSEDQMRSQLMWAVMDQVVIHLSINHATLPRIQIFLSNLQTGLLGMRITAAQTGTLSSKTPHSNATADNENNYHLHSLQTTRSSRSRSTGRERRWSKYRSWSALRTMSGKDSSKTPSISEHPLRLQPEHGIEMSTTVYTGDVESSTSHLPQHPLSVPEMPIEGLSREDREGGDRFGGVRVQKEITMTYERS